MVVAVAVNVVVTCVEVVVVDCILLYVFFLLDGMWDGWKKSAYSVPVPSIVKYSRCFRVVPGSFPYVLRENVGDLSGRCPWCVSDVVGCVVKAVVEECNGGKLVFGSYICIAEKAAVKVGEQMWW